MLVGSLKKDQNVLAKNVEELKRAIEDAVVKVKVRHQRSEPRGRRYEDSFVSFIIDRLRLTTFSLIRIDT